MTMSKPRGYSTVFVQAVQAADPQLLGVQLARLCIARNISAATVARDAGVSKPAVYAWFTGRSQPKAAQVERLLDLLRQYRDAPAV
jgi:DNA-binding phage protein